MGAFPRITLADIEVGDRIAPGGRILSLSVLSALRDPGTPALPGGLLQRAQIVKGWVGDDGRFHQEVVDVAGGANDASVDLDSCAPQGEGHDALCGVWTDPDFDAARRAVYYVRVLENPSCRWSQWDCIRMAEDERPEACSDERIPETIQERLWTSPIWYTPAAGSEADPRRHARPGLHSGTRDAGSQTRETG